MEMVVEKLTNGNEIKYKRIDSGTCYHQQTPEQVVQWLETARLRNQRIRIFLGDATTGRDWCEAHDTMGYIGRSYGNIKIPLLLNNTMSRSGGAILDHCIVKITVDKRVVYQHPNYHIGELEIHHSTDLTFPYMVYRDGKHIASFETIEKAERHIGFLKGERNSK